MQKELNFKQNFLLVITLVFGILLGLFFASFIYNFNQGSNLKTSNITNLPNLDLEKISSVLKIIDQEYYDSVPNKDTLTNGVIKGLVESLGNEYNSFLNPDEANEYLESRSPNIEGIGVTLSFKDDSTYVETVLNNYPAQKAGILTGDIILEVNGESMQGSNASIVASKIRGPAGSNVTLKVYRNTESQKILEFNILREKIIIEPIDFKNLGNGIYKINIYQFLDVTADAFNKKWDSIVNKIKTSVDLKSLIIDLRNNPGGYVYSVKYVLEEFLKSDSILMKEDSNALVNEFRDNRVGQFEDIKNIAILVNEGTASASEIFASSMQDNKRGFVVGNKTVGKGVEQKVMTLDDSSILILVFQRWLTPEGRNISKENPVIPDYLVDLNPDKIKNGVDTQLQKAQELLGN